MAHCPERVAEYDAAAPRRRRARGTAGASAVPAGGVAVTPPPLAPAGFRLATTAEVLAGAQAALVGRSILYRWPVHRWPVQGWVLGKVVRVSRAAGFSHVVRYARGSALGVGVAASLLDTPGPPSRTARGPGLRTGHGGCCSARPSFDFSGTTVMGCGRPGRAIA